MMTEAMRRAFLDGEFRASEAAAVLGIRSPYSTLNRLKAAGVLERTARGTYRFTPLDRALSVGQFLESEAVRKTRADREQVIAETARRRWQGWLDRGYITLVGPRRYRLKLRQGAAGGLVVRRK